jgi:drug/metabolite transporter (DMT)-like permease
VAPALGVGLLGATATVLFSAATGSGMLAVVAVLSSLYPAVTVLLAAVVLRERAGWVQRGGLVLAAAAVTLVALA